MRDLVIYRRNKYLTSAPRIFLLNKQTVTYEIYCFFSNNMQNTITKLSLLNFNSFIRMSSSQKCRGKCARLSADKDITKGKLLKNVALPVQTAAGKVTVVGAGQVGIACALCLLTQVRANSKHSHEKYLGCLSLSPSNRSSQNFQLFRHFLT